MKSIKICGYWRHFWARYSAHGFKEQFSSFIFNNNNYNNNNNNNNNNP